MICLQVDVYLLLHFWLHLGQRSFQIEIFIGVAPPIYILVILFWLINPIKYTVDLRDIFQKFLEIASYHHYLVFRVLVYIGKKIGPSKVT